MNWSTMTKEQKQWLVLGLIVVGGVGYSGLQFGIKPLMAYRDRLAVERGALEDKIRKAESIFRREAQIAGDFKQKEARLDEIVGKDLPPLANTLVWTTEQINDLARLTGLKVEAIVPVFSDAPWTGRNKTAVKKPETPAEKDAASRLPPARRLVSYTVQISLRASFDELLRLSEALEKANPYATMTSVSLSGQDITPTSHAITIQVGWPIPEEPLKTRTPSAPAVAGTQEKKP